MPLAKYAAPWQQLQAPSSGYATFAGKLNPYDEVITENLKRNRTPERPVDFRLCIILMVQG
ncbi:hypothetical protein Q7S_16095 [Rahnella aquatilis HX2]|jgi:hypothetical protein|nr:hypothetical protein Q7S_16095 [Rahnella aquatilis HX2]